MFIYFLPSSLFVLASWTSFLIDRNNIAARCGVLSIVFLALTTLLISCTQSSPRVGAITALTIWILKEYVFLTVAIAAFCHMLMKVRYCMQDSMWTVKKLDRRLLLSVMTVYVIVSVIYGIVICVKYF